MKYLNQVFNSLTPNKRLLLVTICLVLAVVIVKRFPSSGQWLVSLFIVAMVFSILRQLLKLRTAFIKNLYRGLRKVIREIQSISKIDVRIQVLYLSGLLICFITLLFSIGGPQQPSLFEKAAETIYLGLFAIAGSADFLVIAYRASKRAWTRATGKLLLALIASIAYVGSAVMANSLVASAISDNHPSFASNSVNVLQALLTPITYVLIFAVFVALFCLLIIAFVSCVGFVALLRQNILHSIQSFRFSQPKKTSFFKRLLTGKRQLETSDFRFFDWKEIQPIVRPLSGIVASIAIIMSFSTLASLNLDIQRFAIRHLVVLMDFRPNLMCAGVVLKERAAYVDNGWVLVAEHFGSNLTITRQACNDSTSPR